MELTEEQRKEKLEAFRDLVQKFPSETERKKMIFDSLNNILMALGCFINDPKSSLTIAKEGSKEYLVYSSVYGTYKQSITGDSPKALLEDSLKLLFKRVKELEGSGEEIANSLKQEA